MANRKALKEAVEGPVSIPATAAVQSELDQLGTPASVAAAQPPASAGGLDEEEYVTSAPTKQLGVRINELLYAQVDEIIYANKRRKGRYTTMRSVVEEALREWLEHHPR